MRTTLAWLGTGLVLAWAGLATMPAAQAAKPVRPASTSLSNAPPRGVPGPVAGAGLPALMVAAGYLWSRRRARPRPPAEADRQDGNGPGPGT